MQKDVLDAKRDDFANRSQLVLSRPVQQDNASADALANEVLNEYNPRQHANGVVVNRAWQP